MDISIRELVALANADLLNIKDFLDRYEDFLRLLPTATTPGNGAAQLSQAEASFIGAIDDYVTASDKIRHDHILRAAAAGNFNPMI